MSILDEFKNDIAGAQILADWLGVGGLPVPGTKAIARAMACTIGNDGVPCAYNKEPNWWERHAKEPIAEEIVRQLEAKTRLEISTPIDDQIHMCSICGCCLSLKVQVPIEHIARHTPPDMVSRFPSYCWQKKELQNV